MSWRYLVPIGYVVLATLGFVSHKSNIKWENNSFHSSVEAFGAVIALTVAIILYIKNKWAKLDRYYPIVIASFITLGVFDGLHSFFPSGNTFVWFHSLNVFLGGLVIALVWCPDHKGRFVIKMPSVVLILVSVIGALSLLRRNDLPLMVQGDQFTLVAKLMNLSGGAFFLAASIWFALHYKRTRVANDLVFLNFTLLLGISGVIFNFSHLMGFDWWLWHLLRFLAFVAIFAFIMNDIKNTSISVSYNESYLKSIIENEPECVKLLDSDGNLLEMNASGLKMIEADNIEQVRGQQVYGIVAPEHREEFRSMTERVCSGESGHVVFRTIGLKGAERWLESKAVPFRDNRRNTTLLLAVTRDITDRRLAEEKIHLHSEALAASEQRFRNLFLSIRDVIVVADTSRTILDVNQPALRDMFGYELNEVMGERTSVLYASKDAFQMTGKKVFDSNNEPVGQLMEIDFRRKDGTVFPAELFALKLLDEHGEISGNLGIVRDITERKKDQEQIQNSLKEKEVLLREVHHRVKNNMAVISSLLSLQSGYIDDPKSLSLFKESQSRIQSMALVHEKLYKSRDFSSIDVEDYIKTLINNIKRTFGGSNEVKTLVDVERIDLDIDVLIPCGLIINELLTNAFKHAFNGQDSPELMISMKKVNEENVQLAISDNGQGLPEGYDVSNTKGLGLKLVTLLVSQVSGKLEAKSEGGATFRIVFPATIEHARHMTANG